MEIVLFFYNIIMMISFTFSCVDFLVLYNKYRDKSLLCLAVVFFLFIFDNLPLYMYEFLPSYTQGYSSHILNITCATSLIGCLIIFTYRLTIIALEKGKISKLEALLWAVLFIAVFAISTLYTHLTARVGLDVVLGVSAVAVFAHAIYRHKKIGGFPKRTGVPNISAAFLWASMFFEIFSAAESALSYYGIFILSPNRQLSIELLSVFYSVAAVWFLIKKLVSPDKALAEYQPVSENEKDFLNRFSDAYGLTLKEKLYLF